MTLKFLAGMLTDDTMVTVKDAAGKTIFTRRAADITGKDPVLNWNFSNDHIIYTNTGKDVIRWHAAGDM